MDLTLRMNINSYGPEPKRVKRAPLFEKFLSSTDVGEHGKYVFTVPKEAAKEFFPDLSKLRHRVLLCFHDLSGKSFPIRYRYEPYNKCLVLGAGWKDFVMEKKLQKGDLVIFYLGSDGKFYIWSGKREDANHSPGKPGPSNMTSVKSSRPRQDAVRLPSHATVLTKFYQRSSWPDEFSTSSCTNQHVTEDELEVSVTGVDVAKEPEWQGDFGPPQSSVQKAVRLFGVNISY